MPSYRFSRKVPLVTLLVLFASLACAQVALPYVPPELYQQRRRLQEDQITFCVWEVNPTSALDQQVVQELGAALLVEVEIYRYENTVPQVGEDFWERVFIQLAEHCDALMGFRLLPEGYPEWLTPSRPYYQAPHVLAVTNDEYQRLADISRDQAIGSPLFTNADYRFQDYLRTLPEGQRWKRFPYTSSQSQLESLLHGTIEGGIFWAPTLNDLTDGDPASHGIRVIPLDPVPTVATPIGLILREYNTLLRTQLDQAIVALIEDGVITDLLEQNNLPGDAGPVQ